MTATYPSLTVECKVHFQQKRHGWKQMAVGEAPAPVRVPLGRVPRISRLMALAIKFQDMINRGEVIDYAEIARLGYVTRARLTQIMNLLLLAPDIQEEILAQESIKAGKVMISERHLRHLVVYPSWQQQRSAWTALKSR